jgi:hypothetical protein
LLALVSAVLVGLLLTVASGSSIETERGKRTAMALAKAKEGLIAYAVAVQPDTDAKRPGELPCPDLNNDGQAELLCFNNSQRLGRLPWKTLGLSDLRDADGERLWYALSTNFQRRNFNQCDTPGGATCLNSETPGTITVRDASGMVIHDGTTLANNPAAAPSGAIAVVFAPGPNLARIGAASAQDRGCSGDANVANCEQSGICSSTATARCNPANYLDLVNSAALPGLSTAEDNANFADSTTNNGFIAGPLRNAAGEIVLNDTLIVLRYTDLMPKVELRVAREALACLRTYANANGGHYPWAGAVTDNYTAPLIDTPGVYFGRLPQSLPATAASGLAGGWTSPCPIGMLINKDKWWANWVNLVFVAVAPGYAPDAAVPGCGTCLTVNPSAATSRRVIVLVAGRPLAGESRGLGITELAYLEDANRDGSSTSVYKQAAATATFNDTVVYQ